MRGDGESQTPTAKPNRSALRAARFATLAATPTSPAAKAFVDQLADEIEAQEKAAGRRTRARKALPMASFKTALGATLHDLLDAAPRQPEEGLVYRSLKAESFTRGAITYDGFFASVRGLEGLGLLESFGGRNFDDHIDWGDGQTVVVKRGFASRFRATSRLLALASDHGISPDDLSDHFTTPPAGRTPRRLLTLKSASVWLGPDKTKGRPMDFKATPQSKHLAAEVLRINEFLGSVAIEGAGFHGLYRGFDMGDLPGYAWDKGGRLYAYGDDAYQRAKPDRRSTMTLNGEPVVEIDIAASWLTILYAITKTPLEIGDDAYADLGIERDIAKAWLTASLGKGSPVMRWPKRMSLEYAAKHGTSLSSRHKAGDVSAAVLRKYPLVGVMKDLGVSWADLMFLESNAMIGAILALIEEGVPSLPVHDSLIVPESREALARLTLSDHYEGAVGVRPTLRMKAPQSPP